MTLGGPQVPACSAPPRVGFSPAASDCGTAGEGAVHFGTGSLQVASSRVGGEPKREVPPQSRLVSTSPSSRPMLSPVSGASPSPFRSPLVLRPPAGALPGSSVGGGGFLDYDTGKRGEALRAARGGGRWQHRRWGPPRWLREAARRRRPLAVLRIPPWARLAALLPPASGNVFHRPGVAAARARNRGAMSRAGGGRGCGSPVPQRAPWSLVAATAALCLVSATSVWTAGAAPMSREEKQKLG